MFTYHTYIYTRHTPSPPTNTATDIAYTYTPYTHTLLYTHNKPPSSYHTRTHHMHIHYYTRIMNLLSTHELDQHGHEDATCVLPSTDRGKTAPGPARICRRRPTVAGTGVSACLPACLPASRSLSLSLSLFLARARALSLSLSGGGGSQRGN